MRASAKSVSVVAGRVSIFLAGLIDQYADLPASARIRPDFLPTSRLLPRIGRD
jgi:hypothetical protein